MKKIMYFLLGCSTILTVMSSCKKDEIDGFDYEYSSVHFPGAANWENSKYPGFDGTDRTYKMGFSFLSDPFAESKEISIPVIVSGEAVDYDRSIGYKILTDQTTALEDEYVLGEAIVPAGTIEGSIKVTIKNSSRLSAETAVLAIQATSSDDLLMGSDVYSKAALSWNNTVIMPTYIYSKLLFNAWIQTTTPAVYYKDMPSYSPAAHKLIIAATGLSDIPTGRDALMMYMNGMGPYKAYAKMINDYINLYNEEHPGEPLLHDAGDMIGQPITARQY